jgi:signal transduction histidine kinase
MLDTGDLSADLGGRMFTGRDPEELFLEALERVMVELRKLGRIKDDSAHVVFLRTEDTLEVVSSTNSSNVGLLLPTNESAAGRAVNERSTIIVGDVSQNFDYHSLFGEDVRSEIAVPIVCSEEDVAVGALIVNSRETGAFNDPYRVALEGFIEQVKPLITFAKLQADVTEALELRAADDLLVAMEHQKRKLIRRLSATVDAMQLRILLLQEFRESGTLNDTFLDHSLKSLLRLAKHALEIPEEASPDEDGTIDVNESILSAIRKLEGRTGLTIELDLGKDVPAMPFNNFDIILENLVRNAIDAMPHGGTLTIATSAEFHLGRRSGYFYLIVNDTGLGTMPLSQSGS